LLITFATKFHLPSETYISYKFYAGNHQKGAFSEGIFCFCVENVMHVLDLLFFKSSHSVGRLFTHKVLVVIPGQIVLHRKLHWNANLVRYPQFATHQVTLGGIAPIHPIYRLSGTFLENNSGTIPLVSETQEKSWKHRFLTIFQVYEINKSKSPCVAGRPWFLSRVKKFGSPSENSPPHDVPSWLRAWLRFLASWTTLKLRQSETKRNGFRILLWNGCLRDEFKKSL